MNIFILFITNSIKSSALPLSDATFNSLVIQFININLYY